MLEEKSDSYLGVVKKIVVLGAAGVGKSSLVNALLDETTKNLKEMWGPRYDWRNLSGNENLEAPESGLDAKGVTKAPHDYYVYIGGKYIKLIDTPGIGESDTQIQDLLNMLNNHVFGADIEGVLMVTLCSERFGFVAQFMTEIFRKLMPSGNGWESLIVVGTKRDKNDEDEIEFWMKSFLGAMNERLGGKKKVVPEKNIVTVACKKPGQYQLRELTDLIRMMKFDSFAVIRPSADEIWDIMNAAGFKIRIKPLVMRICSDFIKSVVGAAAAGGSAAFGAAAYGCTAVATGGASIAAAGLGVLGAWASGMMDDVEEKLPDSLVLEFETKQEALKISSFLSCVVYEIARISHNKKRMECLQNGIEKVLKPRDDVYSFGIWAMRTFAIWLVWNNTYYISFKGSTDLNDWFCNLGAAPSKGHWWKELHPHIEVHSGIGKAAEDFLRLYLNSICHNIRKQKVLNVFLTGHSLGGGVAQVVKLMLEGQVRSGFDMMTKSSTATRRKLTEILKRNKPNVSVITFAAPSVFSFPKVTPRAEKDRQEVIKSIRHLIVNYVYALDVVPRLPAHVDFAKAALQCLSTDMVDSMVEDYWVVNFFFGQVIKSSVKAFIVDKLRSYRKVLNTELFYEHVGVIHYLSRYTSKRNPKTQSLLPTEFKAIKFKNDIGKGSIVDDHMVFPYCFCETMRQERLQRYLETRGGTSIEKKEDF